LEEEKSLDKKYKPFAIGKITQKMNFGEECWCSLSLFGGVFELPVHPFKGALPFSEQILGLMRQIREESLNS
jgi:hypothetical protein